MVEAAGFSTTEATATATTHALPSHPMPAIRQHCQHRHMGGEGGEVEGHVDIRHLMPSRECGAVSNGMVSLEHGLSRRTHSHTHYTHASLFCKNMHKHKCTHYNTTLYFFAVTYSAHRHTYAHVHIELTFIRGLSGPAVQCSSKLWTARIRGSRALIWELKITKTWSRSHKMAAAFVRCF